MLVHKSGEIKHVGLGELLLHLVKLVGAHCFEVSSLQLFLQELGDRNLVEEFCRATEVISNQLLVLVVSEAVWVQI